MFRSNLTSVWFVIEKPIKVDDLGLPPCVTNLHTEEWLVVWNMFFFPQKQVVANTEHSQVTSYIFQRGRYATNRCNFQHFLL